MLRPLVIDSNYCIINNAAGQISRIFWENIDRTKITPTIVCGNQKHLLCIKNDLIMVSEREWIRKAIGGIRKLGFPDVYYIPDTGRFSWCPIAYKDINKQSDRCFEYIHSISSPQSNHLLAKKLKDKYGVPWIAQFDDPWHDTSGRKYRTKYFCNYDLKLEREVAENADLIIHSNEVIRDIWVERYGNSVEEKMVILPFNFNVNNLPEVLPIPKNSKLEISHIGHIYSTRSAMTVFNALNILKKDNPSIAAKLHFNFVGGIHEAEKKYVEENGLSDFVTFVATLPPEELENYYQQSNMFLIIDVNIRRSPNYPSKLMMYYYYQRPIIGITNPECQLIKELEQTKNTCLYYGEVDKLACMLKDAVLHYEKYLQFDHEYWKRHSVENVQELYYSLLTKRLGFSL